MAKVIRKKQTHWTRFLVVLLATWAMAASNAEAQFPTVAGTKTSEETSNTNEFTVLLPAGIVSGDLIIAFAAKDKDNTATWPSPWAKIVEGSHPG